MKDGLHVDSDGSKFWYFNGKRHREDGPAIELSNGSKGWYLNGEPHREGGPAIEEANGSKGWWFHGVLHREDGPAVEQPDGSKHWYLNGKYIMLETKSKDPKVKILQAFMKTQEVLES